MEIMKNNKKANVYYLKKTNKILKKAKYIHMGLFKLLEDNG